MKPLNRPAMAALAEVGLVERAHVPAGDLSHGEKRALELAIALAMEPKLLLLDEPMAGTGRDETARLVEVLRGSRAAFRWCWSSTTWTRCSRSPTAFRS